MAMYPDRDGDYMMTEPGSYVPGRNTDVVRIIMHQTWAPHHRPSADKLAGLDRGDPKGACGEPKLSIWRISALYRRMGRQDLSARRHR